GSQVPQVKAELGAWLQTARAGGGEEVEGEYGFAVLRNELAAGGDYNLSGERYKPETVEEYEIPRVRIGDVCKINPTKKELQDLPTETEVSFVPMTDLNEWRIGFEAKETKMLGEVGASYT